MNELDILKMLKVENEYELRDIDPNKLLEIETYKEFKPLFYDVFTNINASFNNHYARHIKTLTFHNKAEILNYSFELKTNISFNEHSPMQFASYKTKDLRRNFNWFIINLIRSLKSLISNNRSFIVDERDFFFGLYLFNFRVSGDKK